MKTSHDPRHQQRIKVMQQLFSWDFSEGAEVENRTQDIIKNLEKIDKLIKDAAPSWPLEKINKVDLAVLRQAVFELSIEDKVPEKVIVDEAVEIAKEYGSDSSSAFVNGVLGNIIESLGNLES